MITTQEFEAHLSKNELRRIRKHQRSITKIAIGATARVAAAQIYKAVVDATGGQPAPAKRETWHGDQDPRTRREKKIPSTLAAFAKHDPFLFAWLRGWIYGAYHSWNEALEALVIAQALRLQEQQHEFLECQRRCTRPNFIAMDGDRAKRS